MRAFRDIPMLRASTLAVVVTAAALIGGCDMNTTNPNAPDTKRAFGSPEGLTALLAGAVQTWVGTRDNYQVMPLAVMADNYTASWNNAAMRFYSSVGSDCASRCGWTNSATAPEAAGGPTVEAQWYGYYAVLNAATLVVSRRTKDSVCFDTDCSADTTKTARIITIAKMLQGLALAGIAEIYDQGFILDETTDLTDPLAIPFSTRAEVRDAALLKLDDAYAEAGAKAWSTPADWMGLGQGQAYTNVQIQQVIRTAQAELIAMFPRNAAENATADWARVATLAAQGVSSGTPFDWNYYVDINNRECGLDCTKTWGNSIGSMRVDTRVAALITTNHVDPWPAPDGNPCPTISPDKRVGDGSYGPEDDFNGYATLTETANAGTDFACSGVAIFPPARGQYHQSNLQHIRYHQLAFRGEDLPTDDATGQDAMYTPQMNDLLWAEGLIRSGGSKVTAATLINNSRFGRGGLPQLTGAEADTVLIDALKYEQEIEFMGQGATPFFNRRRSGYNAAAAGGRPAYVDGLIPGTPRHMPVPAKELDILQRALYTFGGGTSPDMAPAVNGAPRRETVEERYRALQALRPHRSLVTGSLLLF